MSVTEYNKEAARRFFPRPIKQDIRVALNPRDLIDTVPASQPQVYLRLCELLSDPDTTANSKQKHMLF